jgi:hypothetical protein
MRLIVVKHHFFFHYLLDLMAVLQLYVFKRERKNHILQQNMVKHHEILFT